MRYLHNHQNGYYKKEKTQREKGGMDERGKGKEGREKINDKSWTGCVEI